MVCNAEGHFSGLEEPHLLCKDELFSWFTVLLINLLSVCFEKVTYKQKIKWPKSYGKYQTLKENRKRQIDKLLKISRKNVI